jgi:PHS family inorganic phosphate transporter-like MFS transporter
MMVAITLMQPLGQVAAAAVGLTVLTTLGKKRGLQSLTESPVDHEAAAAIIDRIWRIVIGVGAIPAFLAIIARVTIPESPRFTLDVSHDGKQALKANQEYLGEPIVDNYDESEESNVHAPIAAHPAATGPRPGSPPRAPSVMEIQHAPMIENDTGEYHELRNYNGSTLHQGNGDVGMPGIYTEGNEDGDARETDVYFNGHQLPRPVSPPSQSMAPDDDEDRNPFHDEPAAPPEDPHPFSRQELKKYFRTEGNWRQLAGVSICWCCLDVAFYGLGIGDPRIIAQIWASSLASDNAAGLPMWGNPADPTLSIYDVLYQDSLHYIITISLGSLLGSIVLLKAIDYVPRKAALAWGFLALGGAFAIAGGIYSTVVYTNLHAFLITFYALLQLLFNLGPNTIIFLVRIHVIFSLRACRRYVTDTAFLLVGS